MLLPKTPPLGWLLQVLRRLRGLVFGGVLACPNLVKPLFGGSIHVQYVDPDDPEYFLKTSSI